MQELGNFYIFYSVSIASGLGVVTGKMRESIERLGDREKDGLQ